MLDVDIYSLLCEKHKKLYVETALGSDLTKHLKDEIIAGTLAGADNTFFSR